MSSSMSADRTSFSDPVARLAAAVLKGGIEVNTSSASVLGVHALVADRVVEFRVLAPNDHIRAR